MLSTDYLPGPKERRDLFCYKSKKGLAGMNGYAASSSKISWANLSKKCWIALKHFNLDFKGCVMFYTMKTLLIHILDSRK